MAAARQPVQKHRQRPLRPAAAAAATAAAAAAPPAGGRGGRGGGRRRRRGEPVEGDGAAVAGAKQLTVEAGGQALAQQDGGSLGMAGEEVWRWAEASLQRAG